MFFLKKMQPIISRWKLQGAYFVSKFVSINLSKSLNASMLLNSESEWVEWIVVGFDRR